ncbi:MAG: DUF485 domain-containing protein [Sulfurimonas sp.]|nr:DUF485 domain-containing protein [Sulfurimonas sp.]MDQ7062150.1 DUF485 domain-containing protein [Sulfurimonas sp.]
MKNEYVDIIKHDPNYIELVSRRKSLTIKLSLVMLLVYFSFILTIAFKPSLLATPISEDSVITYGIPVGIFVIIFAFILTGVYTFKANREFDDLTKRIKDKVKDI